MKKRALVLTLLLVLLFATTIFLSNTLAAKSEGKSKIDKLVVQKLDTQREVRAIVILKDSSTEKSSDRVRASAANNIEKDKIKYNFKSKNAFSASLSEEDISLLQNNPDVENIYLDRPVQAMLQNSVGIINASNTWNLQVNGINLTGIDETICVIDTGVNYSHSSLGGCNPSVLTLNGNNESYILNSSHPYANSTDIMWNITKPGYSNIALHFVNISLEYPGENNADTGDRVIIYSSNGTNLATYHGINGVIQDVWTPSSSGNTIYVRLVTDSSVTNYGFYINQVLNGTTNTTYNWSSCNKVINGWDFVNNDPNPYDDYGHGTHVSGIVTANGSIRGVAPGSKIISAKALSSTGGGYLSDVAFAVEYCTNISQIYNISVISMSLGTNCHNSSGSWTGDCYNVSCDSEDPLMASAINSAVGKNISVVVASGNGVPSHPDGNETHISLPACIQNATPVSSVDKNDNIASYANRGSIVRLFATGGVSTSSATQINSTCYTGGYCGNQGTSMATPHVSGAIALIRQYLRLQNQSKTPKEIEALLNNTGLRITDSSTGINYTRINIYNAITYLMNLNITTIYPSNGSWHNAGRFNITTNQISICRYSLNSGIVNITMNSSDNINFWAINSSIASGNNYNVTFYCNNSYGNRTSAARTFNIDLISPNVTLTAPLPESETASSSTKTFYYNASDNVNVSICSLILNGNINNSNSSAITNLTNNITSTLSSGSYTWNINCTDVAGNVANSSSQSFTITAPSNNNGNNGGGGGGGGGAQIFTYTPDTNSLNLGYTQNLSKDDKIKFNISQDNKIENHTLILKSIKDNSVSIEIRSNPINFTLFIGEERKLNLSNSQFYDLYVKLEGIISKTKAKITIRTINEPIQEKKDVIPIYTQNDSSNKSIGSENQKSDKKDDKIKLIIFAALLIVLVIAVVTTLIIILLGMRRSNLIRDRLQKTNKFHIIKTPFSN